MNSYSQSPAAAPLFDLSGGHPALDLVNTLDHRFGDEGRVESLAGYDALLGFAQQTGLLDPGQVRLLTKSVQPQAAARALRSVRELRWQEGAARSGQPAMAWQWGRFSKEAELPVWILAERAAQLMLSDAMQRVRACGADTCRWLFLDTSRNHTRRWCNMKVCGNRMKARRFQARRGAER